MSVIIQIRDGGPVVAIEFRDQAHLERRLAADRRILERRAQRLAAQAGVKRA